MRRCHSEAMQEYRREHNQEMWDRPTKLNMDGWPPDGQALARHNLRSRLNQAVKLYLEEIEVGH